MKEIGLALVRKTQIQETEDQREKEEIDNGGSISRS